MQESDLQDFAVKVRSLRDPKLHLFELQKLYEQRTSLSTATDGQPAPYHPDALAQDVDDYKNYAARLEAEFIELETQDRFLRMMMQDPPAELTEQMIEQADDKVHELRNQVDAKEKRLGQLNSEIMQKYKQVEESHNGLMLEVEHAAHTLDEIQANKRELAMLDELNRRSLTARELVAKKEQLTEQLVDANMLIDEKRDSISQLKQTATERAQQIQELEAKLQALKAEVSLSVEHNQQRDPAVEKATHWYQSVADEISALFGIEKITETPTSVHVRFDNSARDELRIGFDEVTRRLTEVESTGCDIQDILPFAKSLRNPEEAFPLVIRHAMARIQP